MMVKCLYYIWKKTQLENVLCNSFSGRVTSVGTGYGTGGVKWLVLYGL